MACYNMISPESAWRMPQAIEITREGPRPTPKSYRLLSNLGYPAFDAKLKLALGIFDSKSAAR